MKLLDLTLPTVAENLALDEALLDHFETTGDLLRLWEAGATGGDRRPCVARGRRGRSGSMRASGDPDSAPLQWRCRGRAGPRLPDVFRRPLDGRSTAN